ncbi:T7SS effector LXG polymorphic toxin [Lactococcus garvieae]|uniref:T7SS effector LXG polymorphic toxin n=1 Tax=Lactococcus garvieae TaxID=1363 RepID=UPI0030D470E5
MGFYVDTAEMKKAVEEYQKISKQAQDRLETAKTAMYGIINSNAMHGKVGQAIAADINNNQQAVIVGLKDSYSAVDMELRQAYQDFKGTTGESSDSAVLSEEVLIKAKSDIDKMKQTYQEQVKSFQSVYSSISDLISLSVPKSDFNQVADATKKYADEIIQKVNQFDSKQGNSANEDMIHSLGAQIKAAEKVGGLSYTDPRFLAFANSTTLAETVQAFHKNVTEAEEKQRKAKEKDLNSMTPSEMIAKYGVDDPDVKKRINDINNGISYTALGIAGDLIDDAKKESFNTILEKTIQDGVMTNADKAANLASANVWKNRYTTELASGGIMGKTPGATATAMREAEELALNSGKNLGKCVSGGFALFGGVMDGYADYQADQNVGKAVTHGVLSTGGALGVAYAASFIPGPGWALAAGIVGGVIVSNIIDYAFEQKAVEDYFQNVETNVGNAVQGVSNFFGSVGEALSW